MTDPENLPSEAKSQKILLEFVARLKPCPFKTMGSSST
jgi:hypothetical protein